ncbi:MAG: hypothetical protein J6S67_12190 [Methanobrevibacter sp.]|nr:hypothetical protein [Methanobrevibacter sp.]
MSELINRQDVIDRLKKAEDVFRQNGAKLEANGIHYALELVESDIEIPTIEPRKEIPKGEREFIEILAQNVPEDLCTYPEYKGKPYYSIHYKVNGEDFAGFGTYNPEVLSRYLRDYFMRGEEE